MLYSNFSVAKQSMAMQSVVKEDFVVQNMIVTELVPKDRVYNKLTPKIITFCTPLSNSPNAVL